jgi:hypothetical protein
VNAHDQADRTVSRPPVSPLPESISVSAVMVEATMIATSATTSSFGAVGARRTPSQIAAMSPTRPPSASRPIAMAPASMRAPHVALQALPWGQSAASSTPPAIAVAR